jgi:hypothetical protein
MSKGKVRVLALCGFTQNATIYFKQLGAIRKACKDVDFGAQRSPQERNAARSSQSSWNRPS